MSRNLQNVLLPNRLKAGNHVRLVAPASTPTREGVEFYTKALESWGLRVSIGLHIFNEYGYLAGTDKDRLVDINDALRDPLVRAVIAIRGGKGAYRIAGDLDFAAVRRDPKLVVGFSDNAILHLALQKHCNLASVHGSVASWNVETIGTASLESLRRALMEPEPAVVIADTSEPTAQLTTSGTAKGIVRGGNQDMVATAAGWALPSFEASILLLEDIDKPLGFIDRQLTMLMQGGHFRGLQGVAIGWYTKCGPGATDSAHGWTAIDVLRDRLSKLGVPILGGLPIGHGDHPVAIPLGTMATLDATTGRLTVAPAVR